MLRALRAAGLERVVLVTGDRADAAESIGRLVGVDAVHAETDPREKVAVVLDEGQRGPTVMVGDGINDAPALAAASVGVAMAAHGSTASSETADVVLTVDRIDRLADVIGIARRSRACRCAERRRGDGALRCVDAGGRGRIPGSSMGSLVAGGDRRPGDRDRAHRAASAAPGDPGGQ